MDELCGNEIGIVDKVNVMKMKIFKWMQAEAAELLVEGFEMRKSFVGVIVGVLCFEGMECLDS